MNFEEFCGAAGRIYDSLPDEIKDRISISVEDYPSKGSVDIMLHRTLINIYGFWIPQVPNNITLCYWGFRADNDFSDERIMAVIKHEFEHSLTGPIGLKHSEH